ncbi:MULTISPECIES: helix-turn-helix transcriptional regulator [unclassified Streptomyces]|uniref:helix-turn-helix domain-containing protein n=1 Tax=unclassified Streptomyces TaxID=2593676 RepID=UPI000DD9B7D0|nr:MULTISPECIES: helix-turn-helix transcriptional regulator [unclassified Streptomyces]QZZ32820.1 helix-turn-helix transcriptional regulator [Streptomyces sp. ST1015]
MSRRRPITGMSQEPRERFREVVKEQREKLGLSFRELSRRLGWDQSLLSRLESGATIGSPHVAMGLDTFYGTTPLILTVWELAAADKKQFRPQYRPYMEYEAKAVALSKFSPSRLPGLLQTEAYAREALAAGGLEGEELEQQVEARIGRQAILEGEDPPVFRSILSEAALRNSLRDPAAWREQLQGLLEACDLPNVTIRVLPFGMGLHGLDTTEVTFLRLLDGKAVAYMENDLDGEVIEETGKAEYLFRAYDAVCDLAQTPAESRAFILRLLEEVPCDPST